MTPSPDLIARQGAFVAAAITYFRSPRMENPDVRFALVREPLNPLSKPTSCVTLGELARTIHRDRRGAPIQCVDDIALNIADWGEVNGVGIWTLNDDGSQHRYIGWAWLNGAKRNALEAALAALVSTAPTIGRRASGWAA